MKPDRKTTGLVLGKFMPFHKGHELLLAFSYNFVDTLYIIIDNIDNGRYKSEHVSGEKRTEWLKSRFPKAKIIYLPSPMPQNPDETKDFWNIWLKSINKVIDTKIDYVMSSDLYGYELAQKMKSNYIPFDSKRYVYPISATKIKNNLKKNWNYLAKSTHHDYIMKFAIIGPESAGKSTLVEKLAEKYNTSYAPEYARTYLESYKGEKVIQAQDMELKEGDFYKMIIGQSSLEKSTLNSCNKIMFSDTDTLSTCIWYSWILRENPPQYITEKALENPYDLYIVLKPDITWKKDSVRYDAMKNQRSLFFDNLIKILEKYKKPYVIVGGIGEKRLENAAKEIDIFYKENFNYIYFTNKLK